jgi:hypothetical protein
MSIITSYSVDLIFYDLKYSTISFTPDSIRHFLAHREHEFTFTNHIRLFQKLFQHTIKCRPKKTLLTPKYLYYSFSSLHGKICVILTDFRE